jgi:cytokinin dehydrogenase
MGWAGRQGLKVAPRGQGRSTHGRALAEDELVIDMNALIAIQDIQQDYMIVDAGTTWRAVLDASLAHGLTPPVVPNYLDLSVGGTLESSSPFSRPSASVSIWPTSVTGVPSASWT